MTKAWTRCCGSSSLPLMGIGNAVLTRPSRVVDIVSLPLMGIGNAVKRSSVRYLGPQLITPHGGSETIKSIQRQQLVASLITPHGDRKLVAIMRDRPGTADSLPLMGIGNPPPLRWIRYSAAAFSLPLMGIGNLVAGFALPASDTPSLPLMGIGNGQVTRLIGFPRTAHYPSWGSETGADLLYNPAQPLKLITPHGDRKHLRQTMRHHQDASYSLPLMGIGNALSPALLIGASPDSHYPSWGSETISAPPWCPKGGDNSLPLMGIGNTPAGLVRSDTGAVSLPLMGIGNQRRQQGDNIHGQHLITPHEDRKPGSASDPRLSI